MAVVSTFSLLILHYFTSDYLHMPEECVNVYLLHVVEIIVIINTRNCFVCLQMEHGKKTPVCVTINVNKDVHLNIAYLVHQMKHHSFLLCIEATKYKLFDPPHTIPIRATKYNSKI